MNRRYERLSIQEFGDHLLATGDLDPVYIALTEMDWGQNWKALYRWLVAYWCFYSCGVACWMASRSGREFWGHMLLAAENKARSPISGKWPRGRERRHFRGHQALAAIQELAHTYGDLPEDMVRVIMNSAPTYQGIARQVKMHRGFGPWIAFKIADMTERVLACPVDFSEAEIFMFKDPVKAAVMYWNQQRHYGLEDPPPPNQQSTIVHAVVEELLVQFQKHLAPPRYDRPVGLQEIETILCKWKSHMHGHYPLCCDIHEIKEGLKSWAPRSKLAKEFMQHLPKGRV